MSLHRFLTTSLPLSCIDGLLRMRRIVAVAAEYCFVRGSGTTMAPKSRVRATRGTPNLAESRSEGLAKSGGQRAEGSSFAEPRERYRPNRS
jgi:hypothetical protein